MNQIQSIEPDRQVTGACLKDPWFFTACKEAGVTSEHLLDTTCKDLWREFEKLDHPDKQLKDFTGILERSTVTGTSDLIGHAYNLRESTVGGDRAMDYINMLTERFRNRQKEQAFTDLTRAKNRGDELAFSKALQDLYDKVNSDGLPVSQSLKMEFLLSERRYDETTPPKDNPPIASLDDTGVIWKSNVQTLVAGSKVGKSRFLAAMIKNMVTGQRALGWSENPGGAKVIYLDFEQDHEDFFNALHHQAGVTKDDVYAFNLTGITPTNAIACVEAVLDQYPAANALLLDGVADLCNDVNNPEEANELIARLMALTVKHDVAILGVLHLNPGSEAKSRGHLGSQLERKSKTIIQIDCDDDGVRTVYTKLARKKPISKKDGIRFKWCDTAGNFVEMTETKAQEQSRIEAGTHHNMMVEITEARAIKEFTHKELLRELMSFSDKKESTCKTIIRKMKDSQVLNHSNNLYTLNENWK